MLPLLARLTIAQKLVVSSLVLVLPILVLLYSVVREYEGEIAAARRELQGAKQLEPLRRISSGVSVHQRLDYLRLKGDSSRETERNAVAVRIDEELAVGAVPDLLARWRHLRASPAATPAENIVVHHQLAMAVHAAVTEVGDASGLVLDPDLDCFYLAQLALVLLPDAQANIGAAGALANAKAFGEPFSSRDLVQLAMYAGTLEYSTLTQLGHAMETSVREDAAHRGVSESLQRNLRRLSNGYEAALRACVEQMRQYPWRPASAMTALQLAATAQRALELGFEFRRVAIEELQVLLEERIAALRWKQAVAAGSGLAALALAAMVGLLIARNITGPLKEVVHLASDVAGGRVEAARERLRGGSAHRLITTPNPRDEIVRLVGAIGEMTDSLHSLLAERARSEEALRERERELRLIVDAGPTLISYVDAECRYRWVNKAYDSRFTDCGGIAGKHVREIQGDAGWELLRPYADRALAGHVTTFEGHLTPPGAKPAWMSATCTPDRDESGRVRGFVVHATDITERKQSEQQRRKIEEQRLELLASERALVAERARRETEAELARALRALSVSELAASVAHEVNQPLAGVVTNAEAGLRWLSGAAPNLDEVRTSLNLIVRDGHRASDVIRRIRGFLAKEPVQPGRLDINDVIRDAIALAHAALVEHGVTIQVALSADLPPVCGDRVQLQQVLLNLMLNGCEAMLSTDGPKQLVVVSRTTPGAVVVGVRDEGAGIAPEDLPRMFDALFTTKPRGMGMGLSVSKSIVEAHGGRIAAAANDGPGLTVQFTLPAAGTNDAAATGRPS